VVGALRSVSSGGRRRSSRRVSSAGSLNRSRSCTDTHRAEAIEDCIEFLNSSAFKRSNSTA
ncbi:hypothetical protein M569_12433, partial [Genlisea aurea]